MHILIRVLEESEYYFLNWFLQMAYAIKRREIKSIYKEKRNNLRKIKV